MNFKQFIALLLMCIVGAFISLCVPINYKYTFGFIIGSISQAVMYCLED